MQDELYHFGVKGMKWGVRKDATPGVSRKTDRLARKDAKESTQAKMYYGEGAGTRRKLIKAKVNQRMTDPAYKKAFDNHVARTDMAARADQARGQRGRKDASNKVVKTGKQVSHVIRGNAQYGSLLAMGIVAASTLAYKNGGKQFIQKNGPIVAKKAADVAGKAYNLGKNLLSR